MRALNKVNDGWKPDWEEPNKVKYISHYYKRNTLLAFPTEEKRTEFRDLITDEEIYNF